MTAPVAVDVVMEGRQAIDGDALLRDVCDWFGTYISTVTDADLELLALWTTHTHLVVETYTTPPLQLDSPVPGSGKTTCLDHLKRLCVRPVQMASVSSPALLARPLDVGLRTLLIDEVDRSLNPDRRVSAICWRCSIPVTEGVLTARYWCRRRTASGS